MNVDRIAVLGAGGFIGSHLAPALATRFGCEIDAVDMALDKLGADDPRIHRLKARIEDPGVVERITERASLVISLTALCNPALCDRRKQRPADANDHLDTSLGVAQPPSGSPPAPRGVVVSAAHIASVEDVREEVGGVTV